MNTGEVGESGNLKPWWRGYSLVPSSKVLESGENGGLEFMERAMRRSSVHDNHHTVPLAWRPREAEFSP